MKEQEIEDVISDVTHEINEALDGLSRAFNANNRGSFTYWINIASKKVMLLSNLKGEQLKNEIN